MNLAVIYDSKTGNTAQAAQWIAEGMNEIGGAQAQTFSIDAIDEDFVAAAKGIVIGSPTYASLMTADLHRWLESTAKNLQMAGKLGGAFATAQYTHGGGEQVIQTILAREMVLGMLCYSGGSAMGKPVIHLGPVAIGSTAEPHNRLELYRETCRIYGRRFAQKAVSLFGE